jgi:hypothetical protein
MESKDFRVPFRHILVVGDAAVCHVYTKGINTTMLRLQYRRICLYCFILISFVFFFGSIASFSVQRQQLFHHRSKLLFVSHRESTIDTVLILRYRGILP